MRQEELLDALYSKQDAVYQTMQRRLIPNIDPESIIGVRTPELRRIAGKLEDREGFFSNLPHRYFEENQLHAFILEREGDFQTAVRNVDTFLPYVNNWATCDQLRPRCFQKNRERLLPYIRQWLTAEHPYTLRYGIEMLMCHFLEDDFDSLYLEWVASVSHEDYYVKMMAAWYFATALAKQYPTVLPYIAQKRLDTWTHNKTIQKAVESHRISSDQKEELRSYRIKAERSSMV